MAIPEGYTPLAKIGISYKGDYVNGTTYEQLDAVFYAGSTYLALIDGPVGVPNNDGQNWRYLAQGAGEDINNLLGTTDISAIADGTVTGAVSKIFDEALKKHVTYYPASTAMSADDLYDGTALIPISSTVNEELFNILGGSYAYVITLFYGTEGTRKVQIALSYNVVLPKMAIRICGANGWVTWRDIVMGHELQSKSETITPDLLIDNIVFRKTGNVCTVYFMKTSTATGTPATTMLATVPYEFRPSISQNGVIPVTISAEPKTMYVAVNSGGTLQVRFNQELAANTNLYGSFTYLL